LAEITWHNEKRAIRDLIPYEVNPRQITNKQAKDLKASLAKFGIADPLIINTDNMIIGGHQRKKILETLLGYDPDYQIDVRVPDRELSIDEARELNVRLNKNVADWDFDILANKNGSRIFAGPEIFIPSNNSSMIIGLEAGGVTNTKTNKSGFMLGLFIPYYVIPYFRYFRLSGNNTAEAGLLIKFPIPLCN